MIHEQIGTAGARIEPSALVDRGVALWVGASLAAIRSGFENGRYSESNSVSGLGDGPSPQTRFVSPPETSGVSIRRFELKANLARIAMYLAPDWRAGLFRQIDRLLDEEDWEPDDTLPSLASFETFQRLIMVLGRPRRPGLGCTDRGDIIATWYVGDDRLTLECHADDQIRWVVSRRIEDRIEPGSGLTNVTRLSRVLSPYDPEIWFGAPDAHS